MFVTHSEIIEPPSILAWMLLLLSACNNNRRIILIKNKKGKKRIVIKVNLYSWQHPTINEDIIIEILMIEIPIIFFINSFIWIVSIDIFVNMDPGEFLSIS